MFSRFSYNFLSPTKQKGLQGLQLRAKARQHPNPRVARFLRLRLMLQSSSIRPKQILKFLDFGRHLQYTQAILPNHRAPSNDVHVDHK